MKIIDLLNKIANGEEVPKRIRYKGHRWYLKQNYVNRLPYYSNGYDKDNLFTGEEEDYFSHSLNDEVEIIDRAEDEYDRLKDRVHEQYHEIERLNTNLEAANEDLTRIAQLLNLEEGCTIYDVEDKIERLNNIIHKAIEYIETCNPNVDLNSMFLNENYISNYGAKELLNILRGEDKE